MREPWELDWSGVRVDAPAANGGKPLPAWAANPYEKQIGTYSALRASLNGFQDDYAGNTVTGEAENWLQGRLGTGTPGQRDWWAQFRTNDNQIRNELFGATLTPSEQRAYEATTISPSMKAEEVRKNLTTRREIVRKALGRKTNFLRAQGYSSEAIDALAGEMAADFNPDLKPQEEPSPDRMDIGFAAEAAPTVPGGEGFRADLQKRIGEGEFKTAAEIIAYGKGKGFDIAPEQAEAAIKASQGGQGVAVATPQYQSPDISDTRGQGGIGETADAAVRGAADVLMLGMADEIGAAGSAVFGEGTMRENLARQRAIDDYDEENNFWTRLAGGLGAGFLFPSGIANAAKAGVGAAARRGALEGAGYGAGYGFGSADGDIGERLGGAAVGAGLGGAVGGGLGALAGRTGSVGGGGSDFSRAAARQDIDFLAADVPGSRPGPVAARMATGISRMTLGGIPLAEAAQKTVRSAQAAKERIAQGLGMVSDNVGAGQAAQRGARRAIEATERKGESLYQAIPVAASRPAELTATKQALAELTTGFRSNSNLSKLWADNPKLQETLAALEDGGVDWQDLKAFRSRIGEIAGRPSLTDDGSQIAAMRRLYASLSDDMRATAAAEGPQALRAFERANSYWRGRQSRIDNVLKDVLGDDLQLNAEAAFRRIETMAGERGGNSAKLAQLMRSLPADEAAVVRASIFDKLGTSSPGRRTEESQWSPAEFVTQWNRLSPRAKRVLFQGEHAKAIDDLVRVSEGMKGSAEFANMSRTSLGTNAAVLVTMALADPLSAAVAAAGQLGVGYLLARPAFAKWLAGAPKKPNPAAQLAHIRRLTAVARAEPAIANDVLNLQQFLANAIAQSPGRAAASEDVNQ